MVAFLVVTAGLIFVLVQLLVAVVAIGVPSALVVSTILYLLIIKLAPISRRAVAFSCSGCFLLIAGMAAWVIAFCGFYGVLNSHGPIDLPLRSAARWFVAGSAALFSGFFLYTSRIASAQESCCLQARHPAREHAMSLQFWRV